MVVGVVIQPMHGQGPDLFVLLPLLKKLDQGRRVLPAHLEEFVGVEKGDPLVLSEGCCGDLLVLLVRGGRGESRNMS